MELTDMRSGEASPMLESGDIEELDQLHTRLLERLLGCLAPWQAMWCALLSIFQAICTFHIFVYVFQVSRVDCSASDGHRCAPSPATCAN